MVKSNSGDGKATVFKGNHVLSMNGILLYGAVIACGWTIVRSAAQPPSLILVPLLVTLLFVIGFGLQLFYFKLSASRLEIRNHIFPWYKKEYPLKEISGVVISRVTRQSRHLRINTIDSRTRRFPAGSLRNDTWTALEKALRNEHISVRHGG